MSESLARLIVTLEAQTAQYQKGMEEANRKLEGFSRTQKSLLGTVETGFKNFSRTVNQIFAGTGIFIGFRAMEQSLERVAQKYKDTNPAAREFTHLIENITATMDRGFLRVLESSVETLGQLNKYFDPATANSRELEGATFELGIAQKAYNDYLAQGLSLESSYAKALKRRADEAQKAFDALQKQGRVLAKPPAGFEPGVAPGMFGTTDLAQQTAALNEQKRQQAAAVKAADAAAKAQKARMDELSKFETERFQNMLSDEAAMLDQQERQIAESHEKWVNADKERFQNMLDDEDKALKQQQAIEDEANEERKRRTEAFGDLFANVLVQSNRDGLKQVLSDFMKTLAIMALRAQAMKWFDKATSGTGAFAGILGAIFGGPKAMGGPVAAGTAYLVGERGPEMFVPNSSGSIVPNKGGVVINQNFTVGDVATQSQLTAGLKFSNQKVKAEIADLLRRKRL